MGAGGGGGRGGGGGGDGRVSGIEDPLVFGARCIMVDLCVQAGVSSCAEIFRTKMRMRIESDCLAPPSRYGM